MRVLVTGWFSFLHGEVTAGDALALDAVASALTRAGVPYDEAWSPVFRPEAMSLRDADPARYTHLVFVCGPIHGDQVRGLHERYAGCRRIAVGVSVVNPADPAVTGFHRVLARDGLGEPGRDLAGLPPGTSPVAGVVLALGQGEYGGRRRHDDVAARLTGWIGGRDCAALPLDTRLDRRDWRLFSTADQYVAVVRRLDVVVTTRLHGLVLACEPGSRPWPSIRSRVAARCPRRAGSGTGRCCPRRPAARIWTRPGRGACPATAAGSPGTARPRPRPHSTVFSKN